MRQLAWHAVDVQADAVIGMVVYGRRWRQPLVRSDHGADVQPHRSWPFHAREAMPDSDLPRRFSERYSLTYLFMAVVAAATAVAFLLTAVLQDTSSRVLLIVIGLALLAATGVLATQVPRRSAGRR